jgi:hypothetical protein
MDKVKQNIIQQQQLDKFNIEKSVVGTEAYYINQDIQKGMSQDEIIEKARSGVYKLTAENKKAGRVGQRYGESKKESGTDELMGIKVGEEVQLGNIKGTLVRNTIEKYGKYSIKTPAEKILLKDSDLENLKPLSKESTDKREAKFPSKDKLIEKLISWGNNDEKSKEMVEEHYDYVKRVYPDSSLRELATVIRTIY